MASSSPLRRRTPFSDISNLPPAPSPSKSIAQLPHHRISSLAIPAPAADCPPPDETPVRPTLVQEFDSFMSTPPYMTSQEPFPGEGDVQIYTRRKTSSLSYLTLSCPPLGRDRAASASNDHQTRSRPSKRSYDFTSLERISQDKSKKAQSRSRRRSLPSLPAKNWLPEDFITTQRTYFAEIDAFPLSEEEAGSEEE